MSSWKLCPFCVAGTCGYAIANRKYRANHKGHRFYRPPRAWWQVVTKEMSMRKPSATVTGGDTSRAEPCDMACKFENLFAFVSDVTWDDSSKRTPGTMLLMFEDGMFKIMLNDKALNRFAFVSGRTWEEVLTKAELGVRDEALEWRRSKPFKK